MLEDYCVRCGTFAQGRERWMFHAGAPPAKEFFCLECLRVMRTYAIIGFTFLGLLLVACVVTMLWLGVFG